MKMIDIVTPQPQPEKKVIVEFDLSELKAMQLIIGSCSAGDLKSRGVPQRTANMNQKIYCGICDVLYGAGEGS